MIPELAQVGPVTLFTHDVFTILGILAGLALYYRALRRDRVLDTRIVLISLAAIAGGALGARLITSWEIIDEVSAANLPLTYLITHGPRSIIGGLAGGYLAIVLSKRALGYTLSTGDYYAAAIPLALAIGRTGCFLSELPLGTPTDLPWGMTVSPEAAAAFARCPGCDGPMHPSMLYEIGFQAAAAFPRCPGCNGPMHPSMLYEIGFQAAAFGLIFTRGPMLPIRGDTLKAYLLAYGVFRFCVEFVRGNEVQAWGLTGPQIVLIPLVGLLVIHFIRRLRSGAYRLPIPEPAIAHGG